MSSIIGQTVHNVLWIIEIKNMQTGKWLVEHQTMEATRARKWMAGMREMLLPGQPIRARRLIAEFSTPHGYAPGSKTT